MEAREVGDYGVREAVAEDVHLSVACHIGQRQYGNRRLCGRWRSRARLTPWHRDSRGAVQQHAVHSNGLRDVLELSLPCVLEGYAKLAPCILVNASRHADAAGLRNALQAYC